MLFLGLEFLATSLGETIEFSAPSGVGDAPLGLNPATPLQAVERRIKRALFQGSPTAYHASRFNCRTDGRLIKNCSRANPKK